MGREGELCRDHVGRVRPGAAGAGGGASVLLGPALSAKAALAMAPEQHWIGRKTLWHPKGGLVKTADGLPQKCVGGGSD